MTVRIELVLIDLAAQSIAVNAKNFGRAGLVAVRAVQNALDEALFEFADRLFKKNSALYHLTDESFQFVKRFIKRVLDSANGNQSRAAEMLGIHRNTLSRKIDEYKLDSNGRRRSSR